MLLLALFKSFCTLYYMFRSTLVIRCLEIVGGNLCASVFVILIFDV
jgi:hypothetical protein